MYKVKYRNLAGEEVEGMVDATNEFSASRKAATTLPDCVSVLSVEKAYAPAKQGGKTSGAVAEAAEALREALKAEYGTDYVMIVCGKGQVLAASSFEYGTIVANS